MEILIYLLNILLVWGYSPSDTESFDLARDLSGTYQVRCLKVFDQEIAVHQVVGIIKLNPNGAEQLDLEIDIHYSDEPSMPVSTVCRMVKKAEKITLIDSKTKEVLGYYAAAEIHLLSEDAKGTKTEIIAKRIKS
ncbi:MAG: hypothetical protein U0Y10_00190 [Spirosomataceae bacterium]